MRSFWPGAGTLILPAAEAHAFTVHEFAKPRSAQVDAAKWAEPYVQDLRDELHALIAEPDRVVTAEDLVFAARDRCVCGAGYCYPKFLKDPHGYWLCSAIVLGTAAAESEHDQAKPFAFWSIKSDQQPSANGATTRPST